MSLSIAKVLKNPSLLYVYATRYFDFKVIPDELHIKLIYRGCFGKKLNLSNPISFNEKLQWLKLYDRKPIYSTLVDKYAVKDYISNKIGEKYVIPTLGVWDNASKIDFDSLPDKFVLKCTHDSQSVVVCTDKKELDKQACIEKLNRALTRNYYYEGRQWIYKDVPPRIIAEKFLEAPDGDLKDYKFFCFNGKVKCYKIDFGRFTEHHANYYDVDHNVLRFGEVLCPPIFEKEIEVPSSIGKMMELAEQLSSVSPFMRVDFYDVNGEIYFGEMTFYPASGFGVFKPEEWDIKMGEWIKLDL